jgi:hypothetical protein
MSRCSTFKIDVHSANHKYAEIKLERSLRSGNGERSWIMMIVINVDGAVRISSFKRLIGKYGNLFAVLDSLRQGVEPALGTAKECIAARWSGGGRLSEEKPHGADKGEP